MAERFGQVPQGHEMYCHNLKAMVLNPGWFKLEVSSTSVSVVLEQKISIASDSVYNLTAHAFEITSDL